MSRFKSGGVEEVRKSLLGNWEAVKGSIEEGDLKAAISIVNRASHRFLMKKQDYDYYHITPYNKDVTERCGLGEYINASFVETDSRCYFAAQMPKPRYFGLFRDFVRKSGADLVVSLIDCVDGDYFCESELVKRIKVPFGASGESDEKFFYDETYNIGPCVRRLRFCTWLDHSSPESEHFEIFHRYFRKLGARNVIVHCHAGVGRTGTFIMHDILSQEEAVTIESFTDTFLHLRSCRPDLVFRAVQLKFLKDHFLGSKKA